MDLQTFGLPLILYFLVLASSHNCSPTNVEGHIKFCAPDVIHVLQNTTAWFNFTRTPRSGGTIEWNFTSTDGRAKNLMRYADGILDFDIIFNQRIGYSGSPGSGNMFLNNVDSRDEGRYEVRITHQGVVDTRNLLLHVVPPSKVGVRVSIDSNRFDITLADNGTNVTLPDDRTLFSPNPKVKLEMMYNVPWVISSYQVSVNKRNTEILSNCGGIECTNLREPSTEVVIEVTLGIQNVGTIRITKPMHVEAHWKTTPGHIKVLGGTTASFNWTHDIENAVIEWIYEGTTEKRESKGIMSYMDNQLYIIRRGNRYLRLGYEDFPGSAYMKLRNVRKDDEGLYGVKVVDTSSATTYDISDVAELSVVDVSEIKLHVTVDSTKHELSVLSNGTEVVLPAVYFKNASELSPQIDIGDTAPTARTVRVYTKHPEEGEEHTWIECQRTRHCSGIIPAFYFARKEATDISIAIDFDVENLEILSLHLSAMPTAEYKRNDATVLTSWENRKGIVYRRLFVLIGVFVSVFSLIACIVFKNRKSGQKCMIGSGKDKEQVGKYVYLNDA